MNTASHMRTGGSALAALALCATILLATFGLAAQTAQAATTATVTSPFRYTFNVDGRLPEAGSLNESWSPYLWVNSGAYLHVTGGTGGTQQGPLPANDYWRLLYAKSNPLDTGNGYYPQNIFRLVTRSAQWGDVEESMQFKINKINLTDTPNRDGYSGVLLFGRYLDGQNLYYMGIRMDGHAVIKKKIGGTYYTLAETTVFPGSYDKYTNPNLIPTGAWMAMKTTIKTQSNGDVAIDLYLDKTNSGNWVKVASATDKNGESGGTPVLSKSGSGGIRTDYMDASFDNFQLKNI